MFKMLIQMQLVLYGIISFKNATHCMEVDMKIVLVITVGVAFSQVGHRLILSNIAPRIKQWVRDEELIHNVP